MSKPPITLNKEENINVFKFIKLIACSFLLYFFFAHFTPFIVQFFPNWQAYVEAADEYGIEPGALYYTDVPVVLDAEHASREAVMKAYGNMLGWKSVDDKEAKNKNEASNETPTEKNK